MIKVWILIIGGNTQSLGRRHGTGELWLDLRTYSSPDICVHQLAWNDNMQEMAERIRAYSEPNPRILVAAYSWGAGHGLPNLAKALQDRGLSCHAVVNDPIYRSRLLSFRWLAFVPGMHVRLPQNVLVEAWLTQKSSPLLKGHDLASDCPVAIPKATILDRTHIDMDDAPEYHHAVWAAAERLCANLT